MTLNYKTMIEKIDTLASDEFCMEMEIKLIPHSEPYTQEEAQKMVETLGKIYMISHCIHCEACAGKWKIKTT